MNTKRMTIPIALGTMAAMLTVAAPAGAAGSATVTNAADSGEGTLRSALAAGATNITVAVSEITITSTLQYTGSDSLVINGGGAVVKGNGLKATLFQSAGGADVTITNMTFDDGGNFGVNAGGGYGLHFATTANQTGKMTIDLDNVTVQGVGGHGIYVDDSGDSPATVVLNVTEVLVDRAGIGGFDQDGIRVDETGDGNINFRAHKSQFTAAGADGVELDEAGAGDVNFGVSNVVLTRNGDYCEGQSISNPEDPLCVEEGELDLDDGFDIDEADSGSVRGFVGDVVASNNFDEGLDFDEAGSGGFDVTITDVVAEGNVDEGIKMSEEDAGRTWVAMADVRVNNGKNDAMAIEEAGPGSLYAYMVDVDATGNDGIGLVAEQLDAGSGIAVPTASKLGEVELEGVELG